MTRQGVHLQLMILNFLGRFHCRSFLWKRNLQFLQLMTFSNMTVPVPSWLLTLFKLQKLDLMHKSFIFYFHIPHKTICLHPQNLHKPLFANALKNNGYGKFGRQTKCIMGNMKIENCSTHFETNKNVNTINFTTRCDALKV